MHKSHTGSVLYKSKNQHVCGIYLHNMSHVKSKNQLVDDFTKALARDQMHYILDKLGMIVISMPKLLGE